MPKKHSLTHVQRPHTFPPSFSFRLTFCAIRENKVKTSWFDRRMALKLNDCYGDWCGYVLKRAQFWIVCGFSKSFHLINCFKSSLNVVICWEVFFRLTHNRTELSRFYEQLLGRVARRFELLGARRSRVVDKANLVVFSIEIDCEMFQCGMTQLTLGNFIVFLISWVSRAGLRLKLELLLGIEIVRLSENLVSSPLVSKL